MIKKDVRDLILSALGSLLIIIAAAAWRIVPLSILVAIASTFFATASVFLVVLSRNRKRLARSNVGIVGLWRDERHFRRDKGRSYAEYCRNFIAETPDNQKVRILGYDWVELFLETTVLGNDIFKEDNSSRLKFDVILIDPNAPMVVEKRMWEMMWKKPSGGFVYSEGMGVESINRLKTKVESCVTVAKVFETERPHFFRLKLTPTLPFLSLLMREDKVIGTLYSLPWKGKDSIIFEAERLGSDPAPPMINQAYGGDLYAFLRGYFDSVWDDPDWKRVQVSL